MGLTGDLKSESASFFDASALWWGKLEYCFYFT